MWLADRWARFFSSEAGAAKQVTVLQGLYMWGGVGVGKTMLMDLLVKAAPSQFQVGGCTDCYIYCLRCLKI